MVGHITTINPRCSIAVVGILPRREPDKCMQANQINTLLRLKLPVGVTFIEHPEEFFDDGSYNTKYFKDKVHLNNKRYSIMLEHFYEFASSNVSSLHPFIFPHIHTGDSASTLSTPNDYAIGEPEFMGRGWNGESLNSSSTTTPHLPTAPPAGSTYTFSIVLRGCHVPTSQRSMCNTGHAKDRAKQLCFC